MERHMLVLLNRLDTVEDVLSKVIETATIHGVQKIFFARVSPPAFSSRVRSIVSPHKLEMAAQMGDFVADEYLARIVRDVQGRGIKVGAISTGLSPDGIESFVKKNKVDVIVTTDGRSGLASWAGEGLSLQFVTEHLFSK